MKLHPLHSWDVTPADAVRLQETLRVLVIRGDRFLREFQTIAGMDVSYDRRSPYIFSAVVVLRLPTFDVVDRATARARATFPYVPGLLSFRESPAGLAAWEQLRVRPDCLLCDGHGYAHPRRFGLASHFGLWGGVPTIGCAKSVLVGEFREPRKERGSVSDIIHEGEVVGKAVRTREAVAPVFVSVGHRISLSTAVATVLACTGRYRIPEPIRQAHAAVNRLRLANAEVRGAVRAERV